VSNRSSVTPNNSRASLFSLDPGLRFAPALLRITKDCEALIHRFSSLRKILVAFGTFRRRKYKKQKMEILRQAQNDIFLDSSLRSE